MSEDLTLSNSSILADDSYSTSTLDINLISRPLPVPCGNVKLIKELFTILNVLTIKLLIEAKSISGAEINIDHGMKK